MPLISINRQDGIRFLVAITFTVCVWSCVPSHQLTPSSTMTDDSVARLPTYATQSLLNRTTETEVVQTIQSPAVCPISANVALFELPYSHDELFQRVFEFLNAGGDPTLISESLKDPSGTVIQNSQLIITDANADGSDDIILSVSIFDQDSGGLPFHPIGVLYLFHCNNGKYVSQSIDFGSYIYDIDVRDVDDLTGDGIPELIIVYTWAGSVCVDHIAVLGWVGQSWEYFLQADGTCPGDVVVLDLDADGVREIVFTGYTRGKGALRGTTLTYAFNGQKYELVSEELLPSPVRIHFLQDAQIALDEGSLVKAAQLYQIAAIDSDLINSPSFYEMSNDIIGTAGSYQSAFAYFRAVTLWMYLDASANLEFVEAAMRNSYSIGDPGSEFVDLLDRFISELDVGATFEDACNEIEIYAELTYPNLAGFEGHLGEFWGSNIRYTHHELCPFD
ncbi:MAG: hypothetical protein ACFFCP_18335 [Promethearchaeota archaeon]